MINLTKVNFEVEVLKSEVPTVVLFGSKSNPLTTELVEMLDQTDSSQALIYKFCYADIDEQPDLAMDYSIHYLPTAFVFKQGKMERSIGGMALQTKKDMAAFLLPTFDEAMRMFR